MAGTSGNQYGQTIEIPISNNSPNGTRFEYSDSEMMGESQSVRVTLYGSDGSQLAQIVKTFSEFTTASNDWDMSGASVRVIRSPV